MEDLDNKFSSLSSRVEKYEELLMIVGILAISLYMYVEANSFRPKAAIFPHLAAGAAILGSIIILIRGMYTGELLEAPSESEGRTSDMPTTEEIDDTSDQTGSELDVFFVFMSTFLFVGISVYVSMFFTAPLYVIVFTVWFRQPWYVIAILAALSVIATYIFAIYLQLPIVVPVIELVTTVPRGGFYGY